MVGSSWSLDPEQTPPVPQAASGSDRPAASGREPATGAPRFRAMVFGVPRVSMKALGGLAAAVMLSACAGNYAAQGPLTVETALPAPFVASCIQNLFNTRIPLVRTSPLIGGTLIKVMGDRDHTIAAASVLAVDGRTRVSFASDHADRYWYEELFRACVYIPAR